MDLLARCIDDDQGDAGRGTVSVPQFGNVDAVRLERGPCLDPEIVIADRGPTNPSARRAAPGGDRLVAALAARVAGDRPPVTVSPSRAGGRDGHDEVDVDRPDDDDATVMGELIPVMYSPPSTPMTLPVTKSRPSPDRATIASATSCGVVIRPDGLRRRLASMIASCSGIFISAGRDRDAGPDRSLVFYRHIVAGQVVAYALDPGGAGVTLKIFVNAPFDRYVTGGTRFWQASGIDMSLSSDGVKLRTESLTSILQGGVTFRALPGSAPTAVADDTVFSLYSDEDRAMRPTETEIRTFVMYFKGSLRGLSAGAPVELHGIGVGEVRSVDVEYDRDAAALRFPVLVDLYPQRIRGRKAGGTHPSGIPAGRETASQALIDSLVEHGLRAELKSGNLLTGQKYVDLDMHADVPAEKIWWKEQPAVFPTVSNGLDEIQDSVGGIARKLNKVPFDQISYRLLSTMTGLEQTLKSTDQLMRHVDSSLAPQIQATLAEAQAAMKNAKDILAQDAPLQSDLGATLLQLSRAAKSVTALVEYLERHPESLLRGKPGDSP